MNQKLISLIAVLVIMLIVSCNKDWFDKKSDKNLAVLSSLDDFELLLDDYVRITRTSPALGEIASDGHYVPDDVWYTLTDVPTYISQKNAYTWSKRNLNTEVPDWNVAYKAVFYCNLVLEGIQRIDKTSENMKQYSRVFGNALFHRARVYLELAQVFTPPFDPGKDSPFGLPFKESTDVSEKMSRRSVFETYAEIEKDLKLAAEMLPDVAAPVTRGSKAACWALLARLALITGRYGDALLFADRTLLINDKLLDFNEISEDAPRLGMFNREVIFHSEMVPSYLITVPSACYIDSNLYYLYEENDLRRSRYFIESSNGFNFKGMYTNSRIQFAGVAIDEIYLIRSEAYARTGEVQKSMEVLNTLLRKRFRIVSGNTSTLVERTAENEAEALSIILLERKKELVLRGIRWSDLKRLNLDARFEQTLTRDIGGEIYTLQPNSIRYALPIPDDEVSFSGIVQNPGWDN